MSVFCSHKLFLLSFTSECPLLSSSRSAEDLYEACASAAWLGDMAFWRWSRAWSRGRTHLETPPPPDINHSPKLTRRHSQRCRSSAVEVPGGVGGGGVTDEQLDSVSVSGWEWTNGAWFLHFLLTLTRWLTANQNKWQLKHQLSWACDRVWCNVVDSINNCFKVAGVVCSEMLLCRSWL